MNQTSQLRITLQIKIEYMNIGQNDIGTFGYLSISIAVLHFIISISL